MKFRKHLDHSSARNLLLDQFALEYLNKKGGASVPTLSNALRIKNPSLTDAQVADLVWRLVEQGYARVEDLPPTADSLWQYLGFWERNLWFYASVSASLLAVLVIYALPLEFPLEVMRWVLGSTFVLFIPGYVTVQALFPKSGDLDSIERFLLSFGFSLTLVPLIGLLLNYTPWGITLTPIVISLSLFTVVVAFVALGRRFWISMERSDLDSMIPRG